MRALHNFWNWFWFDSASDGDLKALGLFRLVFCFVMLIFYFTRGLDAAFFYGPNGILPAAYLDSVDFFRYHPTFIGKGWGESFSDLQIQWLHHLFLAMLLMQAVGLFTRFASLATFFLHIAFLNRNMSAMFGADMIGTFFLFYLCFTNASAHYSVDKFLKRANPLQTGIGHIAYRFMQLQLCVVYGYSGLEKLKGTRWWDGSAMWDVLSMGTLQRWDLSFVAHFPILLSAAVYIVLIFEIYFPVLIWLKKFRLPMLLFGLQMHIGIFLFMNLPGFGFMMIALYILFLREQEVERIIKLLGLIPAINRPKHN